MMPMPSLHAGATGVAEHGAAIPVGLHGFEVACDRLLAGISVQPPPVATQPRLGRRILKSGFACPCIGALRR